MPRDMFGTADVVAALSRMLLERQILGFETNFESVRRVGAHPEVKVRIWERDELSVARSRKQIMAVLSPMLKGLEVKVSPEPLPRYPHL